MIPVIEIIDNGGNTVNAYEDKPNGRILAVLQRPRMYSKGPYVITIPRTQERKERFSAGLAMALLKLKAAQEYRAINPME